MTPEEHFDRGEKLLVDAERAAATGAFDLANTWSVMAQAHFGAVVAAAYRPLRIVAQVRKATDD